MADADYWVEQLEEAIDELESDVTAAKKRPTGSAQLSAISKIEGKMYDIKRTQRVLKHEINQLTNKAEKNALGKQQNGLRARLDKVNSDISAMKATNQREGLFDGQAPNGRDVEEAGDKMLDDAVKVQKDTGDALDRIQNTLGDAQNLGNEALVDLDEQKEKLANINDELDNINVDLAQAQELIKNFSKRMAQDKFILCCACLNVLLLVGCLAYFFVDIGGDDDGSSNREAN